ncbi:hypothetical protein BVI434_720014 [Burkholderia vietnamiensis]|nr:hypothetical protein BVI434_720014 [Burkholderia vietnamiensis]
MLRRVVKDHSDIKKSPMMQTAVSVWDLKDGGAGPHRQRHESRFVFAASAVTLVARRSTKRRIARRMLSYR